MLSCLTGPKQITQGSDKRRYIYVFKTHLRAPADIDLLALFKIQLHAHVEPAVCEAQSHSTVVGILLQQGERVGTVPEGKTLILQSVSGGVYMCIKHERKHACSFSL